MHKSIRQQLQPGKMQQQQQKQQLPTIATCKIVYKPRQVNSTQAGDSKSRGFRGRTPSWGQNNQIIAMQMASFCGSSHRQLPCLSHLFLFRREKVVVKGGKDISPYHLAAVQFVPTQMVYTGKNSQQNPC